MQRPYYRVPAIALLVRIPSLGRWSASEDTRRVTEELSIIPFLKNFSTFY
ncbi:MAG: hypothetical protein F6K23_34130 [Okeania sp. SIO2C9]|nr:hypothetical protein [Okeania sp. SIO2C9]NEQ77612.1 hypothetical protein [Okeania sp. SIO2C9]